MKLPTKKECQDMRQAALETPERPTCPNGCGPMNRQTLRFPESKHPKWLWRCKVCGRNLTTDATKTPKKGKGK